MTRPDPVQVESVDILIPTLRSVEEIRPEIDHIEATATLLHHIIASCQPVSAAVNRNFCLRWSSTPIVIMVDDDIEGFTPGWDAKLIEPLQALERTCMVSARLMTPEGKVGPMCGCPQDLAPHWIDIPVKIDHVMPTAAVAFRNWGLRFDERFIGSGWEDGDFCFQYLRRDPNVRFVLTNDCQLIHRNEEKNQLGAYWTYNRTEFYRKWIDEELDDEQENCP